MSFNYMYYKIFYNWNHKYWCWTINQFLLIWCLILKEVSLYLKLTPEYIHMDICKTIIGGREVNRSRREGSVRPVSTCTRSRTERLVGDPSGRVTLLWRLQWMVLGVIVYTVQVSVKVLRRLHKFSLTETSSRSGVFQVGDGVLENYTFVKDISR